MRCARTHGDGRARIRTDTMTEALADLRQETVKKIKSKKAVWLRFFGAGQPFFLTWAGRCAKIAKANLRRKRYNL